MLISIKKIIEKYSNIPETAKWKIIILEYGINTYIKEGFFNYFLKDYKTKYAAKNPKALNYKVYDYSKNKSIIPSEIIIKDKNNNASLVKLRYNPDSPIKLIFDKNINIFRLFLDNKRKEEEISLKVELVKKKGDNLVSIIGEDRISIILFDGCWNWNINSPCLFCDLNPKRKNYQSIIPNLNNLVDFNFDYKKWWDIYKYNYFKNLGPSFKKAFKESKPHKHLLIMSGGFINNKYLWLMIKEFLKNLNKIIPLNKFDNYLNVPPPIRNKELILREIKEMGIKQIQFNLEVIGKNNFKLICPGKSKFIGYDNYIESLKLGIKIFGSGKVRSNFVLGAQPLNVLLRGIKNFAKYGIVSDYSIFQPKKGTKWENKKGLSIEELLEFSAELANIYKQYKFEGIYCSLSSRSSIINEILNHNVS